MRPNLNNIAISKCFAFELGWIIENRREDGFRSSQARVAEALFELRRRATEGDTKAAIVLEQVEA